MTDVNDLVQHGAAPDRPPVIDDVDTRAAALMARLAARVNRPGPEAAEPAPDAAPPAPEEPDLVQSPAPPPDERLPTGRRMAAPPWQSPADQVTTVPPPGGAHGVPALSDGDQPRRTQMAPPLPPPGWNPLPPPPGWPGLPLRAPGPVVPQPGELPTLPHERHHGVDSPSDDEQPAPQFGWRRVVHRASKGRINPGVSAADREQQALLHTIRQPLAGDVRIAVLSIKGGVGKTTTTIGLGSAFAMVRSDRVIAVDANPDRGTLAERVADSSTSSTVRDLLLDASVLRYADVRRHTRLAPSRLEVLASVQDPAVAEIFGESDYRRAIEILQPHYNIILTDCGTGIMHSSMASVLDLAHVLVLVSSPAADAARSAAATLDWLTQHGHGGLARGSHVVFSGVQPGAGSSTFQEMHQYFEARTASVHDIPFEPHLARGADVDFSLLSSDAVLAYLNLAAAVAGTFSRAG